jgi:hypothetical protein
VAAALGWASRVGEVGEVVLLEAALRVGEAGPPAPAPAAAPVAPVEEAEDGVDDGAGDVAGDVVGDVVDGLGDGVEVEADAVGDGALTVSADVPATPLLAGVLGAVEVTGEAGAAVTLVPAVPVEDVTPVLLAVPVVPTVFESRRVPAAVPGLVVPPLRAWGVPASGTHGTTPGIA